MESCPRLSFHRCGCWSHGIAIRDWEARTSRCALIGDDMGRRREADEAGHWARLCTMLASAGPISIVLRVLKSYTYALRLSRNVAVQIHFEGLKEGRLISKFVASFTLEPPPGTSIPPTPSSGCKESENGKLWDAFSRSLYASSCPSLGIAPHPTSIVSSSCERERHNA